MILFENFICADADSAQTYNSNAYHLLFFRIQMIFDSFFLYLLFYIPLLYKKSKFSLCSQKTCRRDYANYGLMNNICQGTFH